MQMELTCQTMRQDACRSEIEDTEQEREGRGEGVEEDEDDKRERWVGPDREYYLFFFHVGPRMGFIIILGFSIILGQGQMQDRVYSP